MMWLVITLVSETVTKWHDDNLYIILLKVSISWSWQVIITLINLGCCLLCRVTFSPSYVCNFIICYWEYLDDIHMCRVLSISSLHVISSAFILQIMEMIFIERQERGTEIWHSLPCNCIRQRWHTYVEQDLCSKGRLGFSI